MGYSGRLDFLDFESGQGPPSPSIETSLMVPSAIERQSRWSFRIDRIAALNVLWRLMVPRTDPVTMYFMLSRGMVSASPAFERRCPCSLVSGERGGSGSRDFAIFVRRWGDYSADSPLVNLFFCHTPIG